MNDATLVLVGNAKAGTISVLRLGEGSLDPLAEHEVGVGCGTFAIDHARGLVHTAVKEPEPAIVTLSFDAATGQLTETARRAIPTRWPRPRGCWPAWPSFPSARIWSASMRWARRSG